jgi:hypothetical protein
MRPQKTVGSRHHQVDMTDERILQISRVFLRLALGITFLVSIADRFGWLGRPGSKNVSWGDWKHFVQYVAILNWFVPKVLINSLATLETITESLGTLPALGCLVQRCVVDVIRFDDEHCSRHRGTPELFGVFGGCWRDTSGSQLPKD